LSAAGIRVFFKEGARSNGNCKSSEAELFNSNSSFSLLRHFNNDSSGRLEVEVFDSTTFAEFLVNNSTAAVVV
jgi:hypothetical protein